MNIDRFSQFEYSIDLEQNIWKDCVVVFDTSALLAFYYYTFETQEKIFKNILNPLKKRLWLPNHVEFEYLKNRMLTIKKPVGEKYDPIIKNDITSITNYVSDLKNKINDLKQKTSKKDTHPHVEVDVFNDVVKEMDNLTGVVEEFVDKIKAVINTRVSEIMSIETKDFILENIKKTFMVGSPFSFQKQMEVLKDSELRFKNEIPPGYKDSIGKNSKSGIQRIGDLIIWYQIIEHATCTKLPIVLVTNDLKEDWCYTKKHSNEVRIERPREELVQEIWDKANVKFWMYNFPQFLYTINKTLRLNIDETVIAEAEVEASNRFEEGSSLLKFTGVYLYTPENTEFTKMLRFFEDGKVTGVTIVNLNDSQIPRVLTWFNQGWKDNGTYIVSGNSISFYLKSDAGQVDYKGVIMNDIVLLDVHSKINGHRSFGDVYRFQSMN